MDNTNQDLLDRIKERIDSGDYATVHGVLRRGQKMSPKDKIKSFIKKQKNHFNNLGEAEKLLICYYTGAVIGTLTERLKNHLSKK